MTDTIARLEALVPPSQDEGDTMLVLTGIQFGKKRLAAMIALAQAAPALLRVARAAEKIRVGLVSYPEVSFSKDDEVELEAALDALK